MFSVTVWYDKLTRDDKNKLMGVVKKAKKSCVETKSLAVLYQEGVMKQVEIMNHVSHLSHLCRVYVGSGRKLTLPARRLIYRKYFVPKKYPSFQPFRDEMIMIFCDSEHGLFIMCNDLYYCCVI